MSDDPSRRPVSRRRLLALVGASGAAGVAGCSSLGIGGVSDGESGDGGSDGDGVGGSDGGAGDSGGDGGSSGGTPTRTPTATEAMGDGGATPAETETPTETQSPTSTVSGDSTPAGDVDASVSGGPGAVVDAYPQFQYDAANTGTGDTAGVNSEPSVAWAWPADPGESPLVWSFATAGSTVFATRLVGEEDQVARMVALDAKSGDQLWQRDLPEGTGRHSNLAVAGGSVYLIGGRTLFSLDAATGETEWTADHSSGTAAPVVAGDTLYTSDLGTVYAWAAGDGSELWSHTPEVSDGLMFAWTPAVRNGHVYVGAEHLQALSPEDGSIQWTARTNTQVTGPPTAGPDRVYVPTDAGETYGFDHTDGTQSWQSSAMSEAFSYEISPALAGDTLYLLDEPTTGLHKADERKLIDVLHRLTDKGNTVVVIEHELDLVKNADHIVDLGPEGGDGGGEVVAEGTPEEVARIEESHTGRYLRDYLPTVDVEGPRSDRRMPGLAAEAADDAAEGGDDAEEAVEAPATDD